MQTVAESAEFGRGRDRRHRLAITLSGGESARAKPARRRSVSRCENRPDELSAKWHDLCRPAWTSTPVRPWSTGSKLARATRRPGAEAGLGGSGALFDLKAAGYADPLLVSTTDGVGTKLKVAIETGLHRGVGVDLVAMCVNDLLAQGAEPLLFLDYFATGSLNVDFAEAVIAGIADGCRLAGAALVGGETAEMPGMYGEGHYDLAGFSVGAVDRAGVLPRLEDYGPAT